MSDKKILILYGTETGNSEMLAMDAERLAKNVCQKKAKNKTKNKPADTMLLESDLSAALKMKVSINHEEGKEKGLISISYKSLDELDRISEILINSS